MSSFEPLLTKQEVAKILRISTRSVDRYIASGELSSVKMGPLSRSTRRISPAALRSFIARKETGE